MSSRTSAAFWQACSSAVVSCASSTSRPDRRYSTCIWTASRQSSSLANADEMGEDIQRSFHNLLCFHRCHFRTTGLAGLTGSKRLRYRSLRRSHGGIRGLVGAFTRHPVVLLHLTDEPF